MTRSLVVSLVCILLVFWAAYTIATVAQSNTVDRLVVVIVVASMVAGGFAAIAGGRSVHPDPRRRGWRL